MDVILERGEEKELDGTIRTLPRTAAAELWERFDWARSGFAGLPEEREAPVLLFLLEYARRTGDGGARTMAEAALERRGRMGDALLACAHLEAYAQTGRPGFREAACGMLEAALRDLRLPGGGFAGKADGTVEAARNARMIAALAKASRVLGGERFLGAAKEARLFLKTRLTQSNGRLWRRWRDRSPMEEGRLEDYALYCWALAELYEADFAVSCLREAEGIADRMADIFRDRRGGFYDVEDRSGAGSGAACLALAKLARLTGIRRYGDMAREQMGVEAREVPGGFALLGMLEEAYPRRVLVCASAGTVPAWLAPVGEEYRLAVLAKTPENSRGLENAAPYVRDCPLPEAGERLYLRRDGAWEAGPGDLAGFYRRLSPERTAV